MINIGLDEKDKKVLSIAYLNYYCRESKHDEHENIVALEGLKKKSLEQLDEIIESKSLEKLSEKYKKVISDIKSSGQSCPFLKKYGYPLALENDLLDVELVRKLLLIDIEEIKGEPSIDKKILELQFFYSLFLLVDIIKEKNEEKLWVEIKVWYNNYYSTLKKYFEQKKTLKGEIINVDKIVNKKEFEKEVIKNENKVYLVTIYKKYEESLNLIRDIFNKVFDYCTYFNNRKFKYLLAALMKVEVCPYCNRQYISILEEEARTTLTFDHYKREESFPLLKLSLYNLIPSCYTCNSTFKNRDDREHLYPWKEGDGGIQFSYDKQNETEDILETFYAMNNCDKILETKIEIKMKKKNKHAENSIKVFRLKDVYQIHNHYASTLVAKGMKYEKGGYKKDIFKILKDNNILMDETYLDEFLYGIDLQNGMDDKAKKISLYKLSSDIIHEIRGN